MFTPNTIADCEVAAVVDRDLGKHRTLRARSQIEVDGEILKYFKKSLSLRADILERCSYVAFRLLK